MQHDEDGRPTYRRLKTIDEIFDEVRGYDIAITNDVALETALNSRIDWPHVGIFAVTPRHLAIRLSAEITGRPLCGDMRLVSLIRRDVPADLRYIYSEVQNFREIRRYTGEVEKHLTTSRSKDVYRSYSRIPTVENVMSAFDVDDTSFFDGKRVAVIGVELFDDLDKHFLPYDYDDVDIFTDEPWSIEEMREIGNDRQLAEGAVSLITRENASDVAIVIKSSSPVADAVRSALYRNRLPFINRMEVRDMAPVRDFLSFLTLSLNYLTVRVGQVRELLISFGGRIPAGYDNYLLHRIGPEVLGDVATELRSLMERISTSGMTFGQVRDAVCRGKDRQHVTNVLRDLEIEGAVVTPGELSNLRYAVDNVGDLTNSEEYLEDERTGVLIADCSNSMFVDRPIVLYLGMEQDWNIRVVGKRYLDAQEVDGLNAVRLAALLQQGQRRVYMVNSTKGGKPAVPSQLFSTLFGFQPEGFGDICDRLVTGRWTERPETESSERGESPLDPAEEFTEPFSQSTFKAFVYCPRKYVLATLLKGDDNRYSGFGNIIHAFAETYVCHRDRVLEIGIDEFVGFAADAFAGLSSPAMTGLDRDRIRLAMESVMAFIDSRGVSDVPLDGGTRDYPNMFMDHFGLEGFSSLCERNEASRDHPMHGHFDLRWKDAVCDYKTGRSRTPDDIRTAMGIGDRTSVKEPDYQPLFYLALARERYPEVRSFDLFYAMDRDTAFRSEGFDIKDSVRRVRTSERSAMDILAEDPDALEDLRDDLSNTFKDRTETLLRVISANSVGDPSEWDSDYDLATAVMEATGLNDTKTNRKSTAAAIRKVAKHIRNGMVSSGNDLVVPASRLDDFLSYLDEAHTDMRLRSLSGGNGFPGDPLDGCDRCEYRDACLAVVQAEEGGDGLE